ncbi:hypothetical protein [Oceanimonas smirnovii]|uniref:hypothetical protein n=1 Tax=Oceanimonas smirnovii TaxID=264574 RepID=UPI0014615A25|nr:hypothetical protein [Oceanimonas smirnovii]
MSTLLLFKYAGVSAVAEIKGKSPAAGITNREITPICQSPGARLLNVEIGYIIELLCFFFNNTFYEYVLLRK